VIAAAQDLTFPARHDHVRNGGEGTVAFTPDALVWKETGKHQDHSQTWKYIDVQRLEIEPRRVHLVSYDDGRWTGRDREYTFDRLPEGAGNRIYPFLAERLDQRLITHLGDATVTAAYEIPAKLLRGRRGANGRLKVGADRIVFEAARNGGESRVWRYPDIQSVSASGAFELTLNTIEGENRFQLKQRLPEDRYQDLWHRISEVNGLTIYRSQLETHPHE
jgi:hypothetical protein